MNVTKLALVFLVGGFTLQTHATKEDRVELQGRALFSFLPHSFMVQTDNYVYKIAKDQLSAQVISELDKASNQGLNVRLSLPRSTIEYLWPNHPYKSQEDDAQAYRQAASQLVSEALTNKGWTTLRGQSLYSFREAFFLVQVNQTIYELKKSALTPAQRERLTKAGAGSRIEIAVPQEAVTLAWNFRQPANRQIASIEEPDEVQTKGKEISVKGTLLYSFDEPLVLIQSQDMIYQIRRSEITTETPQPLDQPGSHVQITAPLQSIEFAWSVQQKELQPRRLPTSNGRRLH